MSNSIFGSSLWAIVVVGGFVILGAAIAWAALNNRQTKTGEARTEDATRREYREEEAERVRDGEV